MKLPTQAQVNAALRYAGTAAGAIAAGVTVLGIIPPDTAHAIVQSAQKVLGDLQQLIGDSYVLAGLVFPIVIAFLAKIGVNSASLKSQIASVESHEDAHVQVTDPKLAKGIPGVEVVPDGTTKPTTKGD